MIVEATGRAVLLKTLHRRSKPLTTTLKFRNYALHIDAPMRLKLRMEKLCVVFDVVLNLLLFLFAGCFRGTEQSQKT